MTRPRGDSVERGRDRGCPAPARGAGLAAAEPGEQRICLLFREPQRGLEPGFPFSHKKLVVAIQSLLAKPVAPLG